MTETETVDHRIGVGQRAQQQREHGIDHEECQDRQQQGDPRTSQYAPARLRNAAAHDLGAQACLSVQNAFPLAR